MTWMSQPLPSLGAHRSCPVATGSKASSAAGRWSARVSSQSRRGLLSPEVLAASLPPGLDHWRSNDRELFADVLAAVAIAIGSGLPGGTSQLPPTHNTASSASQSGAVAWVMPPVGQKRH